MEELENHRWNAMARLFIAAGFVNDNSKREMMWLCKRLNNAVAKGLMTHPSRGHWSVNVTALRATGKLDFAEKKLKE